MCNIKDRLTLFSTVLIFSLLFCNTKLEAKELKTGVVQTESNLNLIQLNYSFSQPLFQVTDSGYHKITIDGLQDYSMENEPVVPSYLANILIPKGKIVDNVEIIFDESDIIKIEGELFKEYFEHPDGHIPLKQNTGNFFPEKQYGEKEMGFSRGNRILNFLIFPVRVDKSKNQIHFNGFVKVYVHLKDEHKALDLKSRAGKEIMQLVDNPGEIPLREIKMKRTLVQPDSLCDPAASFDYIIITSESLKNDDGEYSISAFADYKISKGVSSYIVTTKEIYDAYSGRDNPEKIRNFIKDAYNNWEADYILLAGDVEHVPARFLYARGINVASDLYYACLDGDFNANNNANWGEASDDLDFLFDVYLGRASANNTEELSHFVYKTITYDQSPANASYHTKMVQYNQNAAGIGNTTSWVNPYRALDPSLSVEYHFLTNPQADITLTRRMNSHNLGYYLGASHGLVNSLGNLSNIEANALTNGDQFYFLTSIACLAGRFDKDCIAEHLLTHHRNGGAFAGYFNSQDSYPPYIVQYLHQMRDKYYHNDVKKLGPLRAEIASRYSVNQYNTDGAIRYQAYIFNLLGDPELTWKMKDAEPVDLLFDFDDRLGDTCLDLSTNNNHLILKGNAGISKGLRSQALSLNGNGDHGIVPHNKWNPMGDQMELTISADICAMNFNDNAGILVKGSSRNPFSLIMTQEGKLKFYLNRNSPTNGLKSAEWTSNKSLVKEMWHHVAVVISYQNSKITIYIDGKPDKDVAMPYGWMLGYTSDPLFVGLNKADGDSYFDGFIDNVKIYSNSRSANEIAAWAGDNSGVLRNTGLAHVSNNELVEGCEENSSDYELNAVEFESLKYYIYAECEESFMGSVKFECNTQSFIANDGPFFKSISENDSLFNSVIQDSGTHIVTLSTYSEKDGKGFVLDRKTITVNLVKENTSAFNKQVIVKTDVNIYPNPIASNGILNIAFSGNMVEPLNLVLFNSVGKRVSLGDVSVLGQNSDHKLQFNGQLNQGVWFLAFYDKSNNLVAFKRIVVL